MTKPKRTTKRTTQPISGTPERLALSELREVSTLCKRHWGSGSIRDLVAADGHYRPNLITKVFPSKRERRSGVPVIGWVVRLIVRLGLVMAAPSM